MTIDGRLGWFLQLAGRSAGEEQTAKPRPICSRVFLQPGTLLDDGSGLGNTNQDLIPLPRDVLGSQWLLESYQLWDSPDAGKMAVEWPLSHPLLVNHIQPEALPPGAIQLELQRQPAFAFSKMERNPCPGWLEKKHLYKTPGKPYEASAVIYFDGDKRIAATELFNISLKATAESRGMIVLRRCWISFTY